MMGLMVNVCIFEDRGFEDLLPLTFLRPAYNLFLGTDTLFDKILRYFGYANITVHCRPLIAPFVKLLYKDFTVNNINTGAPCLFVNGRLLLNQSLFDRIKSEVQDHDLLFTKNGQVVAAYVSGERLDYMKAMFQTVPSSKDVIGYLRPKCVSKEFDDAVLVENVWDLIYLNDTVLRADFDYHGKAGIVKGELSPFVSIYNENNVFIDRNTIVEDYVVLNAKNGPIYIEENVEIRSGTRLEGPLYVGKYSQLLGGQIGNSSIGPHCKISGEVSKSIVSSYSNKAHYGYLGHSYLGEWVNLGAGTTTSNLKNTYGLVSMQQPGGGRVATTKQFLGTFFGDYTKTAIGTLLNAGTKIGFGSNLFGSTMLEKFQPSFTWGTTASGDRVAVDKFFDGAVGMRKRRNLPLFDIERDVISALYNQVMISESAKVTS